MRRRLPLLRVKSLTFTTPPYAPQARIAGTSARTPDRACTAATAALAVGTVSRVRRRSNTPPPRLRASLVLPHTTAPAERQRRRSQTLSPPPPTYHSATAHHLALLAALGCKEEGNPCGSEEFCCAADTGLDENGVPFPVCINGTMDGLTGVNSTSCGGFM